MKPSAQRAIDILTSIQSKLGSAELAYLVTPNCILTLSGARGACDGVFYSEDAETRKRWLSELGEVLAALGQTTPIYFSESELQTTPSGEECVTFDVVLTDGLQYTLEKTEIIKGEFDPLKLPEIDRPRVFSLLSELVGDNDIASGILLGYPDKAILSALKYWNRTDGSEKDLLDARIELADYYDCPQPVYSFPESVKDDPGIVAHRKLWSKLLKDYYGSPFHKALEANPSFKKKLAEIGSTPKS